MSENGLDNNISNLNDGTRVAVFKTSDYDLDEFERKAKFKDYDLILCEKCNQRINIDYYYSCYCKDCYNKNVNEEERNRMQYGRCKECFQVIAHYHGCLSCKQKRFQRDFDKWTSGSKNIDELMERMRKIIRLATNSHIIYTVVFNYLNL